MHSLEHGPAGDARRIALVAPPWYPLPPDGYGGIEQVVWVLVRALRGRGHSVSVFGAEGSRGGVLGLAPAAWSADLGRPDGPVRELTYLARVVEAVRRAGSFDVVHDHSGFAGLLAGTLLGSAPVVHTVHGVLGGPQREFYESMRGRAGLVAISGHQRSTAPDLSWIGTVHNAVDLSQLRVASHGEKEGYLLCLARICPEKGQHIAIEVARRTGRRLVLAGKIEPTADGRRYYHTKIEPQVDGDRVVHIPNAVGAHKADLLARASALLAPIEWDEPFGLSVVEAMASGTAAISFARGASPELIRHGETGFVVADADAMAGAVAMAGEVDPTRCAALTRGRFNGAAMADGYERAYARAAESPRAPAVDAEVPAATPVELPAAAVPAAMTAAVLRAGAV